MNLGLYIFNYLQEKGSVELPGFGVFTLYKKSATLDEESSIILPPTQEIFFTENQNVFSSDLSKYISEKTHENLFVVQTNIKNEVLSWLKELNQNQEIYLDELGEFSKKKDNIFLTNKQKITKSPQFFGLEEINLKEIKADKKLEETIEETENQYVFNHSILWVFLFILPVGALIYLGLNYQDQLFGKKSFGKVSVKTSTHRIEKKPTVKDSAKVDSLQNNKTDSIKISK